MSDQCYDKMSDDRPMDDDYSLPIKTESVAAKSKSSRRQHKCVHASPAQFPSLEVLFSVCPRLPPPRCGTERSVSLFFILTIPCSF